MPHFGRILQDLRNERGLSQVELGAIAGVSDFTISRGERSETCPWKSKTALEVLIALHRQIPVPLEIQKQYLTAAGLEGLAQASQHGLMIPEADRLTVKVDGVSPPIGKAVTPEESTVYAWVDTLMEERGAKNVLTALEGLAAGWSVDLPPRITHEEVLQRSGDLRPHRRSA